MLYGAVWVWGLFDSWLPDWFGRMVFMGVDVWAQVKFVEKV